MGTGIADFIFGIILIVWAVLGLIGVWVTGLFFPEGRRTGARLITLLVVIAGPPLLLQLASSRGKQVRKIDEQKLNATFSQHCQGAVMPPLPASPYDGILDVSDLESAYLLNEVANTLLRDEVPRVGFKGTELRLIKNKTTIDVNKAPITDATYRASYTISAYSPYESFESVRLASPSGAVLLDYRWMTVTNGGDGLYSCESPKNRSFNIKRRAISVLGSYFSGKKPKPLNFDISRSQQTYVNLVLSELIFARRILTSAEAAPKLSSIGKDCPADFIPVNTLEERFKSYTYQVHGHYLTLRDKVFLCDAKSVYIDSGVVSPAFFGYRLHQISYDDSADEPAGKLVSLHVPEIPRKERKDWVLLKLEELGDHYTVVILNKTSLELRTFEARPR